MESYIVNELVKTISQFQKQALAELIKQIIIALKTRHYQFEEILDALVQYTKEREDWSEVTLHLGLARLAVLQASARLGVQKEDDQE